MERAGGLGVGVLTVIFVGFLGVVFGCFLLFVGFSVVWVVFSLVLSLCFALRCLSSLFRGRRLDNQSNIIEEENK